MFTNDAYGFVRTYAGLHRDGHACGLGVLTWSTGNKDYAEYGPDEKFDGRHFFRDGHGSAVYVMSERGSPKDYAQLSADGTCCKYNGEDCAPDDPRLLALIAQVAPVKVRPAVPAPPHPQSPPTRLQAIVRCAGLFCAVRRWRPPWPPRCTTAPHAVAGGRAA